MTHRPFLSLRHLSHSYPAPDYNPDSGYPCVIVQENSVLLLDGAASKTIMISPHPFSHAIILRTHFLGYLEGKPCHALEVPADIPESAGYHFSGVRELYGIIPDEELALAAYAVRIIDFDRSTGFCSRCGAETRQIPSRLVKRCTACNYSTRPRYSPAIIVLVKKGDKILLASSPKYPADLHSVLAGFLEPYENFEDCVHREVKEEVGIEVTNIRYFGSEQWPFPDSLMVGFIADFAGGEITIDPNEIASAGWFGRNNLPTLPSPMSISRALIDAWIRQEI
jgi:NAD+ diphosphatase